MKCYKLENDGKNWIAQVRPSELFDLATVEKPDPDYGGDQVISAKRLDNGQPSMFAMVFDPGYDKRIVAGRVNGARELFLEKDEADLAKLALA